MLKNAPTGAPWNDIPLPQSSNAQQLAELTNICWRATNEADAICLQPLRCTLNTEQVIGPDYRMTVDASGVARVMTSRWPILSVLGARVSPRATIPRQWQAIPATAVVPEEPPMTGYGTTVEGASGAGGQAVLIAPGYVSWFAGRNGYVAELAYLNGWPHAGIANAVLANAQQIPVDDVTGFAGAAAFVYDDASTETITVTSVLATNPVTLPTGAVVQVGPGVINLASPLAFGHAAGIVVSAMPQDISWAVALLATAQVLQSGATSLTVQNVTASEASTDKGSEDLKVSAEVLLAPYKRVI